MRSLADAYAYRCVDYVRALKIAAVFARDTFWRSEEGIQLDGGARGPHQHLVLRHWFQLLLPHWFQVLLPHWFQVLLPHWFQLLLSHCFLKLFGRHPRWPCRDQQSPPGRIPQNEGTMWRVAFKKGCRWQWPEKNYIPTPGDTGVHGEDPKNIIQQRKKDEPDIIDEDDEDDAEDAAAAKDANDDVIATAQIQGRPEGVQDRAEGVDDTWRNIADVSMAADHFRQALLLSKEDERNLKVKLDMAEDEVEREGQIITFYKTPNIDWARPFQAKLQGDVAMGDGVARHFLSLVIHKLKHGFTIDVGNSCGAMLFEGQSDHLVPSTSKIFLQNDMFIMAGRMIGHAFLHSGPRLTGLSPAVLHVLAGGTPQTATIALEDITDIGVRETIGPLYEVCESNNGNLTTLSVEQRDAINTLAVEMDYSILKETNRSWLLHNLLQDAVFGRIKEQLKQIKQGLKETYVLDLLEARPDATTQVFPSEAEATCSPEVVLDFIQWPQEDDGEEPKKIKEFLLRFISTVSQDKLKQLVKFWVGWEIPMTDMKVEVVDNNNYPRASTCFRTLRVPSHYQTYDDFSESLEMCLGTSEFGFGLI
ncbi:G2/M phase-specific E3 ubiquitin-protein ligase [Merluccius polli]|uniref:G2/M phase-specific E3 ubiquitin-protein ligase n=1 Tax=Merluccius polli TaxID=89951 RepID=A0AA47M010_MERPO|nr:G2/M phase-specific E3 ubiquitin-protein ligase [Merluccius polli]